MLFLYIRGVGLVVPPSLKSASIILTIYIYISQNIRILIMGTFKMVCMSPPQFWETPISFLCSRFSSQGGAANSEGKGSEPSQREAQGFACTE